MGSNRLPMIAAMARVPRQAAVELADAPNDGASARSPSARLRQSWTQAPLLASVLHPEANSFGVLRLMLALAVLISHAVFLATGANGAEPLVAWTGYSLGQYGVQGFFILSGILVTQSLVSRGDIMDYGRARALRIFPALIFCVLFTVVLLGPALSSLSGLDYLTSPGVAAYIVKTLSLSTGSAPLPGLFESNPVAGVVNQSLWTLKYEVTCYAIVAGLAAVLWQLKASRQVVGALLALWAALMLAVAPNLHHGGGFRDTLAYFTLFFGTGVAAFLLRDKLRLSWQPLPALVAFFLVARRSDLAEFASAGLLGYGLLWLATFRFGPLRRATNASDLSYGTYIYSFPVSQTLLHVWPGLNLVSLIATTLAITLLLAFLSWELIERPALGLVHSWRAGHRIAPTRTEPTAPDAIPDQQADAGVSCDPAEPAVVSLSASLLDARLAKIAGGARRAAMG